MPKLDAKGLMPGAIWEMFADEAFSQMATGSRTAHASLTDNGASSYPQKLI